MSFPYKHVLLIGATSGIGAALADKFISLGSRVTAVGRRTDRLDAFVARHGTHKASSVAFDVTNRVGMDSFVKDVTTASPDIDCIVFNAGTQHPINLASPPTVDLSAFHSEIHTNFSSFVDLSVKFTPHLTSASPSTLIFVGSHLGFVPSAYLPAYCSSKAALAVFAISLREQLRGSGVTVVDLWPPPVQSELHDYMGAEKGRAFGMPVGQFVDEAVAGLERGEEEIIVGTGPAPKEEFDAAVARRTAWARDLAPKMKVLMFGE